jgi:hypothetical protein
MCTILALPQQYGRALFADPALPAKYAAMLVAQVALLRVRLYPSQSVPELHEIRWEALSDTDRQGWVASGQRIDFSRFALSTDVGSVGAAPAEPASGPGPTPSCRRGAAAKSSGCTAIAATTPGDSLRQVPERARALEPASAKERTHPLSVTECLFRLSERARRKPTSSNLPVGLRCPSFARSGSDRLRASRSTQRAEDRHTNVASLTNAGIKQ